MSRRKNKNRRPRRVFPTIIKIALVIVAVMLLINLYVVRNTGEDIIASVESPTAAITKNDIKQIKSIDPDCALVLGASVKADGTPSVMLQDRLDAAIMLYKDGAVPKLLLSGDNGQEGYNEVKVMKDYAMDEGVPEKDIFLDYAGFSTYESVYRASCIFEVESIVVVTQKYHLYRALYGCKRMGIKAYGVASQQHTYSEQWRRDVREIAARSKDAIQWIFKPEPTYLGDTVPITERGGN